MMCASDFDVEATLQYREEFAEIAERFAALNYPKGNGSVGGDSALSLYGAARHYGAESALDIGTHLGKSALLLARAMLHNHWKPRVFSVDVRNVHTDNYTMRDGTPLPLSAPQLLKHYSLDELVTFHTGKSVHVMTRLRRDFDLIMLDGAHDAETVYIELLLAQTLLNDNGLLVMHDVYPDCKPLSKGAKNVIRGPWLALKRLLDERTDLTYVKVPGHCSLAYVLAR